MEHGEIITKWKGYIPIVEEIPKHEIFWEKVRNFMDMVRNIGFVYKVSIVKGKVLRGLKG